MFWYILLGVLAIIIIVSYIGFRNVVDGDLRKFLRGASCIFHSFIFGAILSVCIISPLKCKKEITIFKKQKYYIEEIAPTLNGDDNYAITLKRIELNDWLYRKQYNKIHYKFFVFWEDEILELEEIR